MPSRLLSPDVTVTPLDHEPLPADEVVAGTPTTAVRSLGAVGPVEVGLWEMTEHEEAEGLDPVSIPTKSPAHG